MKKLMSLLLIAAMGLGAVFAFTGCKKNDTIRISEVTRSVFYAPLYIALNKGYFADEGLKVTLSTAGDSQKAMTAVSSKGAEIGLVGPETVVYVIASGKKDYPVVFGQLTKRDGSFLVSKNPEPNFDWTGLNGKRILIGRKGGMPAMTTQYVLNQKGYTHGTTQATVNMDTSVAFSEMIPAFDGSSEINYCTMFEPAASNFVKAGKGHIVASVGRESGEVPFTTFVANKSFLKNNSESAVKFLNAVLKAYNFIMDNYEENVEEVAEALKPSFGANSIEELISVINSYVAIDAWTDTPVMDESAFKRMQDIMQNAGELVEKVDFAKAVDNTYARKTAV